MADDIVSRSVPLVFRSPSLHGKAYAPTPGGEMAYSDAQGLYEWRRYPDGAGGTVSLRIHYSGGDRQGSSDGRMWADGPSGPRSTPPPHALGLHAAFDPARMN